MSLWHGRSKGIKAGYQIFVWILKNFGVFPAYFLLRFVALYYFLFSYKGSKAIYHLYKNKLGYTHTASVFKIYKNYYLLGQCIIDKVVVMSGIKNRFTYFFDGQENLKEIVALKKGGMLISAHIGNWDIAGYFLKHLDSVIHIVMFDGEQEEIKEYLDNVTGKKAINIIFIKNDLSHIYKISEALMNNELVCMHADRFLDGNKTMTTDFLGENARFPIGPFLLAAKFKVPVSYVFAVKENNLHYHLFGSKIKTYDHLQKGMVMQEMLNDFKQEMEKKVKEYPEQWFNYYNFWH